MNTSRPILIAAPTTMELSVVGQRFKGDALVTGIGPVNSAIELTLHLSRRQGLPSLLVLIGICGVYRGVDQIQVGDVVVAKSETFGDMGRCSGHTIHDLTIDGTVLPGELWAQAPESLPIIGHRLKKSPPKEVKMATVMCTSATFERADIIRKRTGAQCENMEGASFFSVANAFGLPFLELRAVSNIVGDSRENWEIGPALEALRTYLARIMP